MTTQPVATTTDEQAPEVYNEHEREALHVWLRLLKCTTQIEKKIGIRLRREFSTTLPRFDLMAELYREPAGLTMGVLSGMLMVTGGNVTGVTDTLEGEGLVERIPSPGDRRARIVRLTPDGKAAFERMAKVHAGWVDELVGGLEEAERQALSRLLDKLKQGVEAVVS